MSSKSKQNKSKNKARQQSTSKPVNKPGVKKAPARKEHGALLIIALVLMGLHGLVAAPMYHLMSTAPEVQRPWILGMMVVHSLADIVAAVAIFYWKKWGLYVYAASTVIALVAGLLSIGAWSVFYMVLPLAILGWILRSKWGYFD